MPAVLAPGLWSLVVSAGLALSSQAGVRAEARAEQVRPPVGENTTTEVLEVEPRLVLEGWSPVLRLELAYAPRYTRLGGDGPDSDSWLHRAWAWAYWRPTAAWQFQTNLNATAGTVDLFRVATAPGLPGEPPPVGQSAPVASVLDYQRFELALAADGRLGRQFNLRGSLGVMREGGANAEEREILPLQQSALVRGDLVWRVSTRTGLAGSLSASVTHYFDVAEADGGSGGPTHRSWSNWMGRAEAIWRYALASHTWTWAGAGVAYVDSDATGTGSAGLQPFGEVGLRSESGAGWSRLSGGVLASAAPLEDRLTGTVAQRAEARFWGAWSPVEHWTLGASAVGARVMSGPGQGQAFTAGETWLSWALRDVLSLTAGGRWTTQWPVQEPGRTGLPTSRWVAYLSIQVAYGQLHGSLQDWQTSMGPVAPPVRPTR